MELKTRKGETFYIDDEDYPIVQGRAWYITKRGYVATSIRKDGKVNNVNLHRLLIKTDGNVDVDHINGNKMDNRRTNLRICTHQQNSCNQKKRSTNKSGYTGVSFFKATGQYEAYIWCNYKKIYLGLFDSAVEAAMARDKAALIYHGQYARLNFGRELYADA